MNTTTITIQWQDYDGYRQALSAVTTHTQNTFEFHSTGFAVKSETQRQRYTPERLTQVMEYFGCMSERSQHKRREPARITHIRFLIWRYCYAKFDLNQTELAQVTKHNRSSISLGLKRIAELLEKRERIQELRKEVYAYCDEIFK